MRNVNRKLVVKNHDRFVKVSHSQRSCLVALTYIMRIIWQTKVLEAKTKVCWLPLGSLGWVMCTPVLSKQVLKEIITFKKTVLWEYRILYLCSTVVRKIVRWFPPVREMPRQERQAKQVPSTLSLTWR